MRKTRLHPVSGLRRPLAAAALLAALLAGTDASAAPPGEQLRVDIDRVLKTLEDPALKADRALVRQRLRSIGNEVFDWPEMTRRSLARHWQPLTDVQREEFVALFSDLLEHSYFSKIEVYGGEKVIFAGEAVDRDRATVRTKVVTKQGTEIPIEYRMIRRGDRWLAYDVIIENVSLVSNYRTQFNQVITTSSYQDLLRKMRSKQDEVLRAPSGGPPKRN